MSVRTRIYIDGFNFYYGAVKGTPWKWLDFSKLCQFLLTQNEILGYKYFTALVNATHGDVEKLKRQRLYLRALRTIPSLDVIYGHFLTHAVSAPLVHPLEDGRRFAWVYRTDEKGSDVNLATHLLADGFRDRYDCAVVVSNDSDLVAPIRVVTRELGKSVGVLNPHKKTSKELSREATFYKPIRQGVLASSQFLGSMTDARGEFRKPSSW